MHSRLAESETLSRDRWTADARAGLGRRCRYSGVLGEGWGVLAGDCWILSVAWPVTLERLNGIPTLERGNDQTIKWLGAWGTIKTIGQFVSRVGLSRARPAPTAHKSALCGRSGPCPRCC